jgi:hypothetical protein
MLNEFICIGLICIAIKSFYDAYSDPSKHIDLDHFPILEYNPVRKRYIPVKSEVVCKINTIEKKPQKKEPQVIDTEPRDENGYTKLQKECS